MKFLFLILIIPSALFSQSKKNIKTSLNTDNVQAIYDSLDKVYYFNSIELETTNKFKFKPGQIPSYDDATYENRINKLAAKSPFNYRYNPVVQRYITMYSKRIKSTGTLLALSELYFPLYEKYLNQYGLPLELKYLSIVESALNPTAVSPCGASGLWQFMYGTGKGYNLEINSYIDERFDPEKETIAACAYLKDLFKIYGQWDLAIAAYNCGPGNVNKGIKKAGGRKDFWAIYDYLPKETQGYVPAFIAASYICEYHEEHNIQKAKAKFLFNELDFIEINFKTSIKQVSSLLKLDPLQLKYLNPKYITGIIPGQNDIVVVPKEKSLDWIDIEAFLFKGAKIPSKGQNKHPEEVILSSSNSEPVKDKTIVKQPALNNSIKKNNQNSDDSPFGTSYSRSSIESPLENSNNNASISDGSKDENKTINDFNKKLDETKSYLCVSNGNQNLLNGTSLTLRLTEDLFYQGIYIPKNSILIARAEFKKQSIILKITSAKTPDGEIPVNLVTEIAEKVNGKYLLEDGFSLLIRA